MVSHQWGRIVLTLSFALSALIIVASCVGLLTPGFYSAETPNWQAQSLGQDMIDLFLIVPCVLVTALFIRRNNQQAIMLWGGVMLYCCYTFVLYCFEVHFNQLFIVYCFCLGLSFYSFVYFLFNCYTTKAQEQRANKSVSKFIGWYFILLAALFYFLWLSEIIPALLSHTNPNSITVTGLFTNGVQVLDLSLFLPAILITGIFLLRGHSLGLLFAPVLLTFFILMDITIGALSIVMKIKGEEGDVTLTAIMLALSLISSRLLFLHFKNMRT